MQQRHSQTIWGVADERKRGISIHKIEEKVKQTKQLLRLLTKMFPNCGTNGNQYQ